MTALLILALAIAPETSIELPPDQSGTGCDTCREKPSSQVPTTNEKPSGTPEKTATRPNLRRGQKRRGARRERRSEAKETRTTTKRRPLRGRKNRRANRSASRGDGPSYPTEKQNNVTFHGNPQQKAQQKAEYMAKHNLTGHPGNAAAEREGTGWSNDGSLPTTCTPGPGYRKVADATAQGPNGLYRVRAWQKR